MSAIRKSAIPVVLVFAIILIVDAAMRGTSLVRPIVIGLVGLAFALVLYYDPKK